MAGDVHLSFRDFVLQEAHQDFAAPACVFAASHVFHAGALLYLRL